MVEIEKEVSCRLKSEVPTLSSVVCLLEGIQEHCCRFTCIRVHLTSTVFILDKKVYYLLYGRDLE